MRAFPMFGRAQAWNVPETGENLILLNSHTAPFLNVSERPPSAPVQPPEGNIAPTVK